MLACHCHSLEEDAEAFDGANTREMCFSPPPANTSEVGERRRASISRTSTTLHADIHLSSFICSRTRLELPLSRHTARGESPGPTNELGKRSGTDIKHPSYCDIKYHEASMAIISLGVVEGVEWMGNMAAY